jgi:glycosyltransferase involved in cell wall biosynthesis
VDSNAGVWLIEPSMPSRPARIVHILGSLESAGLQRRVLTLIRELPQYSHTVIFNSAARREMHDSYAALCAMVHVPHERGSVIAGLRYLPRLAGALRKCDPDVVLAHLFGNHALVSIAARMAGVPATFGVSANNPVHYAGSRWQPLLLAQIARPFCRGEIAVSEAVGALLRDQLLLPGRRVHVVPNGLLVEEVAERADTGRRVRNGNGRAGEHQLLMVGWIARAKDQGTVIRSVALLRGRGLHVRLRLAGGAYRQSRQSDLQHLANELGVSDAVTFLGVRDDVPELMGASDVVILATHSEGFGMVLLEAFASRTPVVATDIPACREVLDNGRCGVLVPPRDPVALADAIGSLLVDENRQRAFVEAAFSRVSEQYHAKRMAAGYARLIEAVVAS